MLVWRSGPRPPRNLARKKVDVSRRADYEPARIYHCNQCGGEFWEDMELRRLHLYEEGGRGRYTYDFVTGRWTRKTVRG